MLNQTLSQKMLQKLSPQQIQLMKLLQIPTATLEQRIKEELESNPALDEGDEDLEVFDVPEDSASEDETQQDEFELDDYLQDYIDDDPSSYKTQMEYDINEEVKKAPIAVENTFFDHLERQLGTSRITDPSDLMIAEQVIGSIDEDGYLRRNARDIADDLLFSYNEVVDIKDVERIIKKIQTFDPPGVASSTLQECLVRQLEYKVEKQKLDSSSIQLATIILDKYFEEFSKKHYSKLKKQLNIDDSQLKDALDEILKLNPKPAGGYADNSYHNTNSVQYVIPDFIIRNNDGELDLQLNQRNAPELRINDNYMEMLKGYKANTKGRRSKKEEKEAIMFIKQKIDSAKWFIDAIKQRQNTLLSTMYAIMQFQKEYFLTGDERRLRPMILKDIAEITNLDISTVSRVANSKFVLTEFGVKKLKEFFSESMTSDDGTEVSTLEIKNILKDIVAQESKRKPYSDEKLKEELSKNGYTIARRTVAKYREQLGIPVARLRKAIV